jgi:hypothetical protein
MSARRPSLSVCREAGTLLRAQLTTTAGIVPRPVRDAVGLTRLGRWWQRLASRHCPLLAGAAAPRAHDLVLTRCRGGLSWLHPLAQVDSSSTSGVRRPGPGRAVPASLPVGVEAIAVGTAGAFFVLRSQVRSDLQRSQARHHKMLCRTASNKRATLLYVVLATTRLSWCFCVLTWATVGLQDSGPHRTPQR